MNSDEWQTPKDLFDALNREFRFDLDPACNSKNRLCPVGFCSDEGESGLWGEWGRRRAFVNPPYSRGNLDRWCLKCVDSADLGATVVALIPCDCSTHWWQKYVMQAYEIRFLPRRVRFTNPETGKPIGTPTFGSVIAVWGPGCGGAPPRVRVWDWREESS